MLPEVEDLKPFALFNVFVQANTIHGFRYLDDAGKVLNKYADNYENHEVGLNGLLLRGRKTDDGPEAIRVDVSKIWVHFSWPDSAASALPAGFRVIRDIAQLINVSSFSRLGIRSVFHFSVPIDSEPYLAIASKANGQLTQEYLAMAEGELEFDSTLRWKVGSLGTRLAIQSVRAGTGPTQNAKPETDGILVDIDVHENGTLDFSSFRGFSSQAVSTINLRVGELRNRMFGVTE